MFSRIITSFIATAAILTVAPQASVAEQKPKPHAKATAADMLPTQVLLDRAGFSPGEIDARGGRNTQTAIAAFEKATGTKIADALAASTDPATITYTISDQDAATPTVPKIPEDMMEKAKLKRLEYTSTLEMLRSEE